MARPRLNSLCTRKNRFGRALQAAMEGLDSRRLLAASLFFEARGATTGQELYAYDGNTAALKADIVPGATDSGPNGFAIYKGYLFFSATTATHGTELWKYDGTSASRITDINPGAASSIPSNMTVFKGKLYFSASDATTGNELWRYDAATNAVSRVADIRTGANNSSSPSGLTVLDGKLYFGANDGTTGAELWSYDGTNAPSRVADLNAGAEPGFAGYALAHNGKLYFSGADHNVVLGQVTLPANELQSYDPVTNTFTLAGEGPTNVAANPFNLTLYNGRVYMSADDDGTYGRELYVHDPTQPIANLTRLTNISGPTASNPSNFSVFNGKLYFSAYNNFDTELYSFNSSGNVLTRINIAPDSPSNQSSSPGQGVVFNNKLYFSANARDGFGSELFSLDANGTITRVTDINNNAAVSNGNSAPNDLIVYDPSLAGGVPQATNDTYSTDRARPRVLSVLANDIDGDDDPLSITKINGANISVGATITLPSGGKITRNADNTLTYDPAGAFNSLATNASAIDTFSYTVSDGALAATATVNMTVSNLADLVVNTFNDTVDADNAITSLREAVIGTNVLLGERVISLPAGTYNLSLVGALEDLAQTGDLDLVNLTSRIIIRGAGAGTTFINASGLSDRAFHVMAGVVVEFEDVTIKDAVAQDDGALTTSSRGGGILNAGDVTLKNTTLLNNKAVGRTGANGANGYQGDGPTGPLYIWEPKAGLPGLPAFGGGVYSTGKLTLLNATLNQNAAIGGTGGQGGTAFTYGANGDGPHDFRSCGAVGGVGAPANGGGIYSIGTLAVSDSAFNANQALGGTGGRGGDGAKLKGASSNAGGNGGKGGIARGGALFSVGASQISTPTLDSNLATGGTGGRAGDRGVIPSPGGGGGAPDGKGGAGGDGYGGALFSDAFSKQIALRDSAITNNKAVGGTGGAQGIWLQNNSLEGSPGAAGSAFGGGIGVATGAVSIVNSTVSTNTATNQGGGAFVAGGSLAFTQSTIAFNTAAAEGGGIRTSVPLVLVNTIVSNNSGAVLSTQYSGAFAAGSKNNLLSIGTGATGIANGTAGNLVGTSVQPINPRLGALQHNGGPTKTHALLSGSPAWDAGDNAAAIAAGLATDQRGPSFPRIADAADAGLVDTVDIGAFEAHPSIVDITDKLTNEDTPLSVTFNVGDVDLLTSITASATPGTIVPNDAAHLTFSTNADGSRTLTIKPQVNANGPVLIVITVTATNGQTVTDSFMLNVQPVNDAPQFTPGPNVKVLEDSGATTIAGWATGIAAGPVTATDESAQVLSFSTTVVNVTNGLFFSSAPFVSPDGTLTFTPSNNSWGTATFRVKLTDSGSGSVPNVNVSNEYEFTITVDPVNDAPVLGAIPNIANAERGVLKTLSFGGIGAGAGDGAQTLSITATSSDPSIVPDPAVNYTSPGITGSLSFTPAKVGQVTITVTIQDNGGTANGGVNTFTRTFTVNVVDTAAPSVVMGDYLFDVSQPELRVQFSEDVGGPTLTASDFIIQRVSPNPVTIDPATYVLNFDPATAMAKITFPGHVYSVLPDGNYTVTLAPGGVVDGGNNVVTPGFSYNFFTLAGDATRSKAVNFDDLLIVAQNYGQSGMKFSQGDFTYDGVVNFDDLLLLAQRYGTNLASASVNDGTFSEVAIRGSSHAKRPAEDVLG